VPGGLGARCEKALGLSLGAARRQIGCAAAWSVIDGSVRDGEGFALLLEKARAALALARREDAGLTRAVEAAERIRARLKQGARNLGAAAAQRAAAADLARLAAQPWAVRLPWTTLRRLDQLIGALERRLESASKGAAEAVRIEERILRLGGDCAAALAPEDARWQLALGLAPEARRLRGQLEECALAYATPGAGAAAARAEGDLRLGCDKLEKAVDAARARIDAARRRLLETKPLTGRIADATRRQRAERELDELHRSLPDLTVGADLEAQERSADALVARVRAAL